jgi:hypothetical protein
VGASKLLATMHFEFLVKRYVSSVLAIFLILSATVFVFVIHNGGLKAGLFRHEGMLAAYFGIYALAAFLIDMGVSRAISINGYVSSALTLCFVIWISVIRPLPLPHE